MYYPWDLVNFSIYREVGRRRRPPVSWTGPEESGDTASMRLDTMRRGRGSESLHRNNSGMRCHGKSRKTVEFQRFPLIFIDFLWFPLISNDFQWFPMVPLIFCNFARQWCRVGGSEGRVGGGWWSNECPNMHAVFPMPQDPSIGPVDAYGDRTSRQIENIAKSHG